MNHDKFMDELSGYWSRLEDKEGILTSIYEATEKAPEAALTAIIKWMKQNVPPTRLIGVSDIREAAGATNSALSVTQARGMDIVCDACSTPYSYSMGILDVCPRCRFPGETQLDCVDMRNKGVNDVRYWMYYERRKEEALAELATRIKTGYIPADPE